MLLKYFYDKTLAQASYMVGCQATGEALVIDPSRDIQTYLQAAADEGLQIRHVTETHIHADFVSGARELATATQARLYLSDLGGPDWTYAYRTEETNLLHDGDVIKVGNVRLEVLYTPGHTPEHIAFLLTDTKAADKPMGLFTGDALFVGDVGRPDLLDEVGATVNSKEAGGRDLFHSLARLKNLPDYLQIWPGHGAGSACGKALGAVPSTALGYEKLFNPALQFTDEDSFVAWLLDGQPEAPRYFARMKHVNKAGPDLLKDLATPKHLPPAELPALLESGALVVDMRNGRDFQQAFLSGTLSIPLTSTSYTTYVGWFVDYAQPFYFIAPDAAHVPQILSDLRAIGVDNVPGYFTPEAITGNIQSLPTVNASELAERMTREDVFILDVRNKTEYIENHIRGARHIPLGHLPRYLDDLPKDRPIATHCASGYRSQVAASLLHKAGFQNVINVKDTYKHLSDVLPSEA